MPYYVYKIFPGATPLLKNVELDQEFEEFQEAKQRARTMRAEMEPGGGYTVKVMFAESRLQAEELLMEQREKPILREWEK